MADPLLSVLSLCSGIGGLDLGLELAWPGRTRVVAMCERDPFAAAVLLARMEEEALAPAPVWCGDLAGMDTAPLVGVDVVTAGFPCQPWSTAGSRRGTDDDRWLWPDIVAILRAVGPQWVVLENVPGVLVGGMGHVLGDLAGLGFDAEWGVLSAAAVGATHRRGRVFVVAHAMRERRSTVPQCPHDDEGDDGAQYRDVAECGGEVVAHAGRFQGRAWPPTEYRRGTDSGHRGPELPAWPPGPDDHEGWRRVLDMDPTLAPCVESPLRGVADGAASRLDRLRALGNAVVPAQAAEAIRQLTQRLGVTP